MARGTDQRVTAHLAALGRPTRTQTLAEFTQHRTPQQTLDALADRAWLYQHQLTNLRHQRGMTAARQIAGRMTQGVAAPYTLRALITPADQQVR
ncbi:hypothetical protein [Streptomyces sp. 769]|uniref:hypothetical protein n=1 Tax=Streptomyces sp. 769 TaxID=1262452 RepID=UPI0005822381|nr:hypothetical protein [Streptomyces sp. 769]AJC52752.1 hypothetical protein GZL_00144 [Streptomyces sp. 769]